jgi:hypothetical protein
MPKSNQCATAGASESAVEFLILAVKLAKERNLNSIPLPFKYAESILDMLRNPPQESIPPGHPAPNISPHDSPPPIIEATRLTQAEAIARTNPHVRAFIAHERAALKDAGRTWHQGM